MRASQRWRRDVARPAPLRSLELCAGVGALGLGIARVLPTRTVCYVEREAFAASRLAAGMGKWLSSSAAMPRAPGNTVWPVALHARASRAQILLAATVLTCWPTIARIADSNRDQ